MVAVQFLVWLVSFGGSFTPYGFYFKKCHFQGLKRIGFADPLRARSQRVGLFTHLFTSAVVIGCAVLAGLREP